MPRLLVAFLFSQLAGLFVLTSDWAAQENQALATLTKMGVLEYPPSALLAMISGDVEVEIVVRQDGSVESSRVVSGHNLLSKAALDSARQSNYECPACAGSLSTIRLLYSFRLGPTIYCPPAANSSAKDRAGESYPKISQEGNHLIIVAQPQGSCDPASEITRFRAAKCLYLWKCGKTEKVLAPNN